jgi:lipid-binding SYLF domain-containing protein
VYIAAHSPGKEAPMHKTAISCLLASLLLNLTVPAWAVDKSKDEETIKNAATVLQAMLSSKAVPDSLLVTADCIIVLPSVKKFAVGVGGSGGRGAMSCRDNNFSGSKWSAPAMYTIGGASAGVQLGGSSTDFVLLVMSPGAVNKVLAGKVKVGSDLTAAAGPGATTSSNVAGADILTYGRAKGLFAGISLDGASLEPDSSANQHLYDKPVSASQIVIDNSVQATSAGQSLITVLDSRDWH